MGKRAIVTGATGMIGVSLVRSLISAGWEVVAVCRPGSQKRSRLSEGPGLAIVECDAGGYPSLRDRVDGRFDAFYHLAWEATGGAAVRNADVEAQAQNTVHTIDAVRAAASFGCRAFVGAGSQAEYGLLDVPRIAPDSPADPSQPYGVAKYAAGKMAALECARLGLDCSWVRIFSVYGELDRPSSLVSSTLGKLLVGERPALTPCGQRWDFLFASDAGEALRLVGEKSRGGNVYCLGSGEARPLSDYVSVMRDTVNPSAEVGVGDLPYPEGVVMNLCADISSLTADTGWRPKVSFEEGIGRVVEYLRNREGGQ